jgi:hypothetical protein
MEGRHGAGRPSAIRSHGHSSNFQGQWHEDNAPIVGPRTHELWLGSTEVDGARAFYGPDRYFSVERTRVHPPPDGPAAVPHDGSDEASRSSWRHLHGGSGSAGGDIRTDGASSSSQ